MIVYKCIMSEDEMFTETANPEIQGGFYVVKGKHVTRKGDGIDERMIGGNASAEEASEESEEASESGVDIVLDHRLQATGFGSKKDYQAYMKDYMKAVFAKLAEKKSAEEVAAAKAEAAEAFKEACGKFKNWEFFMGESMAADGHIALMDWIDTTENGETTQVPTLFFYKAGIMAEKY